jgi:hypothetical protein
MSRWLDEMLSLILSRSESLETGIESLETGMEASIDELWGALDEIPKDECGLTDTEWEEIFSNQLRVQELEEEVRSLSAYLAEAYNKLKEERARRVVMEQALEEAQDRGQRFVSELLGSYRVEVEAQEPHPDTLTTESIGEQSWKQ